MYKRFHDRFATAGVVIAVIALAVALALPAGAAAKPLSNAQIVKLIKKYAKKYAKPGTNGTNGSNGAEGKEGPAGKEGPVGPSTGPAGGALAGTYPNPTLANESVGTANFAAGAVAPVAHEAELFGSFLPAAFQKRVSGTCTGNNAIQSIAAAGTVTCQPTGTGTVTSVTAGTGLSASPSGPITTSGTLAVNPTEVQSRVSGTCAAGQAVKSIAQGGTVTCESTGESAFPTLPSGKTETGKWSFSSDIPARPFGEVSHGQFDYALKVPISFNIPFGGELDSGHALKTGDTEFGTKCTGTPNEPKAASGYLCVYVEEKENAAWGCPVFQSEIERINEIPPGGLPPEFFCKPFGLPSGVTTTAGVFLIVEPSAAPNHGFGSWAVTG